MAVMAWMSSWPSQSALIATSANALVSTRPATTAAWCSRFRLCWMSAKWKSREASATVTAMLRRRFRRPHRGCGSRCSPGHPRSSSAARPGGWGGCGEGLLLVVGGNDHAEHRGRNVFRGALHLARPCRGHRLPRCPQAISHVPLPLVASSGRRVERYSQSMPYECSAGTGQTGLFCVALDVCVPCISVTIDLQGHMHREGRK